MDFARGTNLVLDTRLSIVYILSILHTRKRYRMARELWWASLDSHSPRYGDWFKILGTDRVLLTHPGEAECNFIGEGKVQAYALALERLTPEQFDRLVAFVAHKFKADRELVSKEVLRDGFPIRAEDVYITYDMRAFL